MDAWDWIRNFQFQTVWQTERGFILKIWAFDPETLDSELVRGLAFLYIYQNVLLSSFIYLGYNNKILIALWYSLLVLVWYLPTAIAYVLFQVTNYKYSKFH